MGLIVGPWHAWCFKRLAGTLAGYVASIQAMVPGEGGGLSEPASAPARAADADADGQLYDTSMHPRSNAGAADFRALQFSFVTATRMTQRPEPGQVVFSAVRQLPLTMGWRYAQPRVINRIQVRHFPARFPPF